MFYFKKKLLNFKKYSFSVMQKELYNSAIVLACYVDRYFSFILRETIMCFNRRRGIVEIKGPSWRSIKKETYIVGDKKIILEIRQEGVLLWR